MLKLWKDFLLKLSLGVLGVFTFSSVFRPEYSMVGIFLLVFMFSFPTLVLLWLFPTILFLMFFTIMAPFFYYFPSFLAAVNIVGLLLGDLVNCLFSRKAFRLLLEVLVFMPFFLALLEVSSLLFLMELVMEVDPIDISALFLVDDKVDFLILVLYWEVDIGLRFL